MTWGEIAQHLQSVFPDLDPTLRRQSINLAHEAILNDRQWKALEAFTTIRTVARYSTGTVSLTDGSAVVTGSGTTFSSAMVGRQFRLYDGAEDVYTVAAYTSATQITLDRTFAGDDVSGVAYSIAQFEYSLPQAVRQITAVLPQFGDPLEELTQAELETKAARAFYYGPPCDYALVSDPLPQTAPVLHKIAFFPTPDLVYDLRVVYVSATYAFDGSNTSLAPLPFISRPALLSKAKAIIENDRGRLPQSASHEAAYQQAMFSMRAEDNGRIGAQPLRVDPNLTPQYRRRGYR